MAELCLTSLQRKLLQIIQSDFPIVSCPYQELAQQVGASESEVIETIRQLCEQRVIRDFAPVFDYRRLGYAGTLAAVSVPAEQVDQVAAVINAYPEVTHSYLRDHRYNLWFTVIAPSEEHLQDLLTEIEGEAGCPPIQALPTQHVFKINVAFDFNQGESH